MQNNFPASYSSAKMSNSTEIKEHCNRNMVTNALLLFVEVVVLVFRVIWEIVVGICISFIPVPGKPVKGEIVLITGTGHGLGRELALQYASNGATVVCLDINKEGNEETVAMVNTLGLSKAHAYICDVRDYEKLHSVVDLIHKEVGDITILVNNAAIMPTLTFGNHTKEQIEQIMDINVLGYHWAIKAVLPTMLKNNRGHIVAICSLCGLVGMCNLVPYCASKFAIRGLMDGLRKELDFYNHSQIKTTTIYPYIIDTGLAKIPRIRFPKLLPILKPSDVAKLVIDSQRKDVLERTIPKEFTIICGIFRIIPHKAKLLLDDFMKTYIDLE